MCIRDRNRSAQTTNVSGADFIAALSTQAEKNGAQIYLDVYKRQEQIRLGKLKLVPKEKNEGPYEITEMTSKDDGSFVIRLNATKMLHFASISSTAAENVLDVLELIINDKPVEEWKGLLVPQGEIVIQGLSLIHIYVPDSDRPRFLWDRDTAASR